MLLQCCWRKSQSVFGAPNGHDGHNEGGERGAPGAMALEMEMEEDAKTPLLVLHVANEYCIICISLSFMVKLMK